MPVMAGTIAATAQEIRVNGRGVLVTDSTLIIFSDRGKSEAIELVRVANAVRRTWMFEVPAGSRFWLDAAALYQVRDGLGVFDQFYFARVAE